VLGEQRTPRRDRGRAQATLLGFPKGLAVDFVVRHVRRSVPEYSLPEAVRFPHALAQGKFENLEPVALGPEDIAFLQYTGGTTGVAKGAVLDASEPGCKRHAAQRLVQAGNRRRDVNRDRRRSCRSITSLRSRQALFFMGIGGHNLLIPNRARLSRRSSRSCASTRSRSSAASTRCSTRCCTRPGFEASTSASLEGQLGGGMAVQRAVASNGSRSRAIVLTQAWGSRETSPGATINRLDATGFNGSIGLPLPSTDITIRTTRDACWRRRRSGEICVQGPQVMREYWKRPDETAKVMLPDRVLRTGDIGRIDAQGYVYIEDRKKGHDPRVGVQRVPERGRGRDRRAPGRASKSPRVAQAGRTTPARSSRCSSCARTPR
jgi:long-chain acyl-CoA synthetase